MPDIADHDFMDFNTAWSIAKEPEFRLLAHHERCSFPRTNGALLCDCNTLPVKWAEYKGFALDDERVTRYLSPDGWPAGWLPEGRSIAESSGPGGTE